MWHLECVPECVFCGQCWQKCQQGMYLLQEYVREREGDASTSAPAPNPLMMGMDAGGYVLKAVGSVKVHALHSSLAEIHVFRWHRVLV